MKEQKLMKKVTSLLITFILVLNIFGTNIPVMAAAPETIAAWDYTAAPTSAVVPATSDTLAAGAVLTNFAGIIPAYSSYSLAIGNNPDNSKNWVNGVNEKYWQIGLSTKGYDTLTLSAKTRSSGTGPKDFKLIYSTDDGINWNDVPSGAYAITGTSLNNYMPTITLPANAANADKLLVRFIMTSNISSRAGTGTYSPTETVASGGTSNINNIIVTGTPVTNTSTVGRITAVPANGAEVALGSKVALTCETEGATIMYSVNDSEFAVYNQAAQIVLTSLPAEIKAYGTKEGFTNSETSTFNYTQGKVAAVTSNPASGAVDVGTAITLSTATADAAITYKLNDGTETLYTVPITLDQSAFLNGTATIKAKAAKDGLTASEEVSFAYTLKDSIEIVTAQVAKGKPVNSQVRVKGIVTYTTQPRTIFMQDSSGGICVDSGSSSINISSYVGKEIDIIGTITTYGGMVQIKPATLGDIKITNETPAMPEPLVVSINELNTSNRIHEGKLIKVENAQIKTIGGTGTSNYNHTIAQGSDEITLRSRALTGRKAGDFITITGVAGYFDPNPQVQANVTDIIDGVAPAVENVTAEPTTGSTLPIGGTVTLSTSTADATILYSLNGGAEQTIASNSGTVIINEFNQPDGKAIIKAKAAKGSYSTPEAIFTYTQAKTQKVTATPVGAVSGNSQITLSAAKDAIITYIVTKKAGLPDQSTDQPATYTSPIQITENMLPAKITAQATLEGYLPSDPETFDYYLAPNKPYKNYFGLLHSQTAENSDGAGTLSEAYAYARDVAKLDFFAITDHSNSFDTKPAGDKAGTYNLGAYNKDNPKWVNGQQAAINARRENFVSVYGYEMTWSGGPGHINTFATEGFVSRNNTELNAKANDAGLKAYYQLLKDTPNSIAQFNHPSRTFGTFNDYAYLDPIIDARISLIEVGNGEGAVGSGSYFPSYEEYIKALDKGWHLAPTNNQDNHKGKWGDSNTARTVIYTNDLSVNGLYDALRNMRVYSTEDNNLDIVYTLNGEKLGTILQDVPGQATFDVSAIDPDSTDKIMSISIISNGGENVYTQTYNAQDATLKQTISNPEPGYYYIKVVQEDGQIAVTAPIWLGSAPRIGIDSVQYDTMMPVTNEPVNFTTKLFNNEAAAVTVKSLSYKIKDGITIGTYDLNGNIPGSSMYTHTQNHIFTQPGIYTLTVTAVISQNGKDAIYTKDIEVNVRDSAKLMYVGIDASHNNEYVTGNYKASMGNFAKLAAKFNIRVVELGTSDELISAMQNPKYKMMVFTVPSRRDGTAGRIPFKSYSQNEIDAVSAFAKSGKTVIITGWGDYYESYSNLKSNPSFTTDQHMAAQQNKLLAAIGASLRIADDEAKDDSNNGGQAPRLYLTDYNNFVDPFTQGIIDAQVFSQYGGTTIFAVDSNGNPLTQLPSNIKPTISGHATTYSSDDDKDGNAVPPKYNNKVLLMANEMVTHQNGISSTVIAAGGAFMSNFEIQVEVENAGTLPYGNYNILQNIIASLSNISTIADVWKMPVGTDVIIEGIATTDVYNGSDSNKGFFDCIYVQDGTGGINLFPVSSGVEAGQRIRVTGRVSEYQGEKQIQNAKVTVINSAKNPVAPKAVTPEEAMLASNTGTLVTFNGTVTEIVKDKDGVIGQLMVSGARVYINGYITKNVSISNIKIGDTVQVTGISSIGENMSSNTDFLPRIRVRDRGEIVVINSSVPVTGVSLNTSEKTLKTGDEFTLAATVAPANASNKNVIWTSSDNAVATVVNGVVKALKAGQAEITVKTVDGGFEAKCTITVTQPVTGITLNITEKTLKIGESATLTATVTPEDASNKNVIWTSSDNTIATVESGVVKALKVGQAEITAKTEDGSFEAKCTITVIQPVIGIVLNNSSLRIRESRSYILEATVIPQDATNKAVVWSSSNTRVATVDNSGKVTAISEGVSTITATTVDGGFRAECIVNVISAYVPPMQIYPIYVNGVKLNKTEITLKLGAKESLTAEVSPSNADNKSLVWSSSNPEVASVVSGVVTAISAGSTVITVKTADGGFTASCKVTVVADEVKVLKVTLDKDTASVKVGEKVLLSAKIEPKNAKNKEVLWSSSNTDIAVVSPNGEVTAIKQGTAVISVKTVDGGFQAYFTINIAANTSSSTNDTKPETNPEAAKKEILVTASKLNVRMSASTSSKAIGSVSAGQKLEYLGLVNGWYKIMFNGKAAYIHSNYAKLIEASTVSAANNSPALKQVVITAKSGLVVRDRAQATGSKIGLLKYGTKVNVFELINGWYRITLNGKTGYISSKYTK